jgi:hypothetical protein
LWWKSLWIHEEGFRTCVRKIVRLVHTLLVFWERYIRLCLILGRVKRAATRGMTQCCQIISPGLKTGQSDSRESFNENGRFIAGSDVALINSLGIIWESLRVLANSAVPFHLLVSRNHACAWTGGVVHCQRDAVMIGQCGNKS